MDHLPVFCGKDCGATACPLLAERDNGRVVRVINNPAGGPYLKGCLRGFHLPAVQYAEDRLLTPLIRIGPRGSGQYREAGWDEALDYTASRLANIRERHGATSVLCMNSAGNIGALHGTSALLLRFLSFFGGFTRLTSNYSNGAAVFALPYVLGADAGRAGWDADTLKDARLIILWGANLLDNRMGGGLPQYLLEAKANGTQVIVIDPRCTSTAKLASDWWIPIKPGTDAALMLAVLYVLITENLVDRMFVDSHSVGFDALEAYVMGEGSNQPRSPQWAEHICGVKAEDITRLARMYGSTKPAMLFPGYAIQRVFAGEETFRLSVALQTATGNFGVRGGSTGALNNRLPFPRHGSLPVPDISHLPSVPVARWADAVLRGYSGDYGSEIHAIYNLGSNFINQGGDVKQNMAAFDKVEFAVTHELFMTPTARWCDVIFPAATALEIEDICEPWLGNHLLYKPQVLPPDGQARSDYDALSALAGRLGFADQFTGGRTASEWVQAFIDQSEVDNQETFKRTGIYFGAEQERVGLSDFSRDPHVYPLRTPSGKIEIASQRYSDETGFPAIPTWQDPPGDNRFPLTLITPKCVYRTHSQGSNIPALDRYADRSLQMHPQDMAVREITDGSLVKLYNDWGSCIVSVRASEAIMPGVLSLLEGVWVELNAQGVDTAGSANMLTSNSATNPAQANIQHGVPVQCHAVTG